MMKPLFLVGLTLIVSLTVQAQLKFTTVDPSATAAGITEVHSGHLVVQPAREKNKNLLIIMIPGTGGNAADQRFKTLDSSLAVEGYSVISLDYVNQVVTTVCSKSTDSTCFDNFRQEIFYGTPVSDKVKVDSVNSILNRITKLLVYLEKNDPKGGWANFIRNGKPRWDRIIAAGHSQGAGHAGFIGQHYAVKGVMMLSGPQDYLQEFNSPAAWQRQKGKTPVDKYYAFLHIRDPYVFDYQLKDVQALRHTAAIDTVMVQPGVPFKSNRHVMVTDIESQNPHGSTLDTEFNNVRAHILNAIGK
ncbi:hypothetical protein DVR12_01680 [Chitinophaga silvatica]|uniref:Alpha/beta hydrolase n=1 Tax=Chitinophaga silvatica TaxID=2282649 RepID=A0A3E1YGH2_9BACT|nr:hypothetical protein [Chitinophaga silvatica]RFS26523.1 hypothetical protein DVR12_01680 [Chitinophaga silvatica]